MLTPAQDAGDATKPKPNTSSHGRQATCMMGKQVASSYQSAEDATPVQVPPMATTSDGPSNPHAIGD
jgi:hypothetical protein